jgi:hypothetical protein
MATNLTSSNVAGGDDALATQYNNLRKDVIQNAGDYETSAGSANAYTLSIDSAITSYAAGQVFKFNANFANTGSATLNVNTIGAKTLKKHHDVNLEAGDIESGQLVVVMYDGTNMQVLSQLGTYISTADKTTLTDGTTSDADALHTHEDLQLFQGVGGALIGKKYHHTTMPMLTGLWGGVFQRTSAGYPKLYGTHALLAPETPATQTAGLIASNSYTDDMTGADVIVEWDMKVNGSVATESGYGLGDSQSTFTDYDHAGEKGINFSVDSSGNLYAHTSGGGGGTDHTETSISGVALTNKNRFRIEFTQGTDAKFYVNGILKATVTTTLPTSAPLLFGVFRGTSGASTTGHVEYVSDVRYAIEE